MEASKFNLGSSQTPKRLYVDDLEPGMILAQDVHDRRHPQVPILLQKDTELTSERINLLISRQVMEVYVIYNLAKKSKRLPLK